MDEYREKYRGRPYEKPVIKEVKTMNFSLEILASATGKEISGLDKQCSSCHNCR